MMKFNKQNKKLQKKELFHLLSLKFINKIVNVMFQQNLVKNHVLIYNKVNIHKQNKYLLILKHLKEVVNSYKIHYKF